MSLLYWGKICYIFERHRMCSTLWLPTPYDCERDVEDKDCAIGSNISPYGPSYEGQSILTSVMALW